MTRRPCPLRAGAGLALAVGALLVLPALAQENKPDTQPGAGAAQPAETPLAKQTAQAVNYRERPHYPFDPQRLKRRPTLDGVIADNEWDPLYTVSDQPVKGTVYMNWDDDYVYLASKTDQPAWVVWNIDGAADGWLRGADNLELAVAPLATGEAKPAVTARILDAAGSKDAPVWNDKVVDPRSIQIVQKAVDGGQVTEMAIPKGIAGIVPRLNATLSCRADILPASVAPVPTAPYEPHLLLDVSLVEARVVGAPGVSPRLSLEDGQLIPGQALRATLDLQNMTEDSVTVRNVTWQGEGAAADILKMERTPNVPPIQPLKTLKVRYGCTLPATAVPGFYQLTATAQLEGGRTTVSTVSFSVTEPFMLQVVPEDNPIRVMGPTKTRIFVDIYSAVPGSCRADVELEVPAGWIVQGRSKKDFFVPRADAGVRSPFYLTLPSSTQAGDYAVTATVHWRGRTWKTRRTVSVAGSAAAPAPPPAGPK